MASNKAHHATGWAAGVIAAALVSATYGHFDLLSCGLAMIAGIAGSTAPDWLEVAWWRRQRKLWVTHRTVTHWGVAWFALLAVSHHYLGQHPAAALGFGFACGGIMHLLADWPNPLGVPWFGPRHSLNLWTSGRCDLIVVGVAWAAALFVADDVWFHQVHGRMLLHALHKLPVRMSVIERNWSESRCNRNPQQAVSCFFSAPALRCSPSAGAPVSSTGMRCA